MLSVLDQEWLELSPTATYDRRWALWTPGISFIARDRDVLSMYGASIHQQEGVQSGNKIHSDQYQVEFNGPAIGAMGYEFTFLRLNHRKPRPGEREGPYRVLVGPNLFFCNCMAGDCKVNVCKHRSMACRAIVAGLVDGAKPWHGMPESEEGRNNESHATQKKGETERLGEEADGATRQVGRSQPNGSRKADRRESADLGRLGTERHPAEASANAHRTSSQRVIQEKMQELHNAY